MVSLRIAIASALILLAAAAFPAPVVPDTLPEGRWTGALATRTTPDVDNDGEWQQEVALLHCKGKVLLQRRKEDGTYTEGFELFVTPFRRMFVLAFLAVEYTDARKGWIESQVWTLVDARPKGWTMSQSRAVLNQDSSPEEPWYTFRWLALGSLEFDPEGCKEAGAK